MGDRNRWFSWRNILLALLAFQLVCLLSWIPFLWPKQVVLAFVIPEDELISWQEVSQDFEESHPGIHIKLVTTTATINDQAAIYKADFSFNKAQYDLVYMDIIWTAEFANHLTDLEVLMKENGMSPVEVKKGFLKSEIDAGEVDGKLYRMPMRADIGIIFYRTDLLEDIGAELPTTFSELRDVATAAKKKNLKSYLWQGSSDEELVTNFVEVLYTMGGTWIDTDTEPPTPMLSDEKSIKAAKTLWELIHDQQQISPDVVTDYERDDALNEFGNEDVIFLRGWPAFYEVISDPEFRKNDPNFKDKVEVTLPFSFGQEPGKGCRGGWGFGIPKNATHPKEAWEAIRYFTSAEGQRKFVSNSGYLPTRTALLEDEEINARYSKLAPIYEYLKDTEEPETKSVFRPNVQRYTEASDILQQALRNILKNERSNIDQAIDSAMQEAQNQTEKLFDSTLNL